VRRQVVERDLDRVMKRTANRPLVTGRIAARDAVLFAAALATIGTVGLAVSFGVLAALLGLATLIAYSLVYTPLKRVSALNTLVGAVPGALPAPLGWAAASGSLGQEGVALFLIMFVWQLPHFLPIAWLYRDDYKRARLVMITSRARL